MVRRPSGARRCSRRRRRRPPAEANYCTVDLDTEISTLLELYKRFRVAIVLNENNEPFDIITRIDLLDYINQVTTQAASL